MKTTKNSGNENRRVNPVTQDRMKDVDRKDRSGVENNWREKERKEEEWDAYDLGRNSGGNGKESGMTVESKTRHETENKSIHVEDWENDPFEYRSDEDDVKSEFDIRKGKNRTETGEDEENHEWQEHDSGSGTKYNRGNEYRKSGTDETLGVP